MAQNIISSLGGGSGIDTLALVDSLIAAERAPREAILDSKTRTYETQISGYGALRSAMSGIQDSVKLLSDADTFNARSVSFPDSPLATPTTVNPGALAGDYAIEVTSLASAHAVSAGGFVDPDSVVGTGTLTFTFGDWDGTFTANGDKAAQSITIDSSNNTLTGIRDAINDADFGVQASIIEDAGAYTLQVTSSSGANNELQISTDDASLDALTFDGTVGGMTQNQSGADASLKVNGLAVTRESNHIDDVVSGLEFTLNQVSVANETMTISVTEDNSIAAQTVRDFVDIYNEFLSTVGDLTTRTEDDDSDEETTTLGSLSSDPSAKFMVNQVRSLISQTVPGLDGNFTALAMVGIQTEIDGTITLDDDIFQKALDDNYSAVTDLFTGKNSSTDARVDIVKTKASTASGSYEVVVSTDPAKGYMVGGGITAIDATALGLVLDGGSNDVFSGGLDTSLGDYSFKVSVDGTESELITLAGNYADTDALIADMQAQINGDANVSGVGAALDISYDTATASFTATSRAYGSVSKIAFSDISDDMSRFSFGGGESAPGLTTGAITDSGATEIADTSGSLSTTGTIVDAGATDLDTQGSLTTTAAINAISTTLDASDNFTVPLDTSAAVSYNFAIKVDNTQSGTIELDGIYNTAEELRADLELQINNDVALSGAGAAVTVAYDTANDKFTFTSNLIGASSTVEITAADANMADLGIAAEVGTTDDAFVSALDTSGGGYTLNISVDGTASSLVTLSGSYATAEDLRADLEAQINADAVLTGAGAAVTVGYDTVNNRYSITSDNTGAGSSIDITAVGANMGDLGFSIESGVDGVDDTFVAPLSGAGYSFDVALDGGAAMSVDLASAGPYSSVENVRAEMESQLTDVTVGYDATTDSFSFTSTLSTGAASTLVVSNLGANIGDLGISADSASGNDASSSTVGVDVSGTINGVSAFGSGNIMLPSLDSELAGLSLAITPGVTSATITLSQGFSAELDNVLEEYLKNNGLISERETRLNSSLDDIKDDRSDLDRRIDARRQILQAQFLAMERIISSLSATSDSLDGLIDRLPFTAQK